MATKSAADSATKINPAEKIYLQFDKHTYFPTDTLWFKAYIFSAPTLNLSAKSGVMYVSIVTDSDVVVRRQRLPVENGLSWGNISLKDLPSGVYTLVAYTQWLQNFNRDCFFQKQFTIVDDAGSNWLANYTTSNVIKNGRDKARVQLQLHDVNKKAIVDKPVQLIIIKGNRRLYRQAVRTDEKGIIDVSFNLQQNLKDIRLIASDADGNRVNIPLCFNRPEDTDIQFMPEGGELIAGLPARVGIKALGADGRGVNVSGQMFDHEKNVVATFETAHLGIGSFNMPVVNEGEKYTAKIKLPGGISRDYPMPEVKKEGILLNVINEANEDSVRIAIAVTEGVLRSGESYMLIGKSREVVCYGAVLNFKNNSSIRRKISKKLFPSGITHLMLLDMKNRVLNERLIFINRQDALHLDIRTVKKNIIVHDSVVMNLSIVDTVGRPMGGDFSIAVTDDALVHPDSVNSENILTHILLTAELKGYVENPNYYFNANNRDAVRQLDNLLLTQGWVSYAWPEEKGRQVYLAEKEIAIKGKVVNAFNKPIKAIKVQLLSKSPLMIAETVTDKFGQFTFRNLPATDTPSYFLKTSRDFNVSIKMDDPPVPVLSSFSSVSQPPWYASNDSTVFNSLMNNKKFQNLASGLPLDGNALKEVKVIGKKIVKGSQNLNGSGEADLAFNEADVEKAAGQTLLDFFKEKIPGFRLSFINKPSGNDQVAAYHFGAMINSLMEKSKYEAIGAAQDTPMPLIISIPPTVRWYFIDNKPVRLIVDGISVGSVFSNPYIDHRISFDDLKNYLESHDANDIKGVEVLSSAKYAGDYYRRYIPQDWQGYVSPSDFAFIELTTRSGQGPVVPNTPGKYLYKPLAISLPAKFYKPRYAPPGGGKLFADFRSTIDWEPNVIVGESGKATISFLASAKPSTYTVIIEGTNMDGSIGYKTEKIKVSMDESSK